MKKTVALAALIACAGAANAQMIVAQDDLDGNTLNLLGSTIPALDGGGGDYFGVGSTGAWPQSEGVPFSLADDSVADISGGGVFADDNEGIFGVNRDPSNNFFGMSDSDEFGSDQTASWDFDISGYSDLSLAIDFGGISNDSFDGYSTDTVIEFTASIDGGASQLAFTLIAVDNNGGYVTRVMDNGNVSGGGRLLEVFGDNAVTKLLAEDGSVAGDTYLDKSVVDSGEIDTFMTALNGTGSVLTITLNADLAFEAAAFDNIRVYGIPAPASAALLGLGGLAAVRRRR